jgi:hypothetical protein
MMVSVDFRRYVKHLTVGSLFFAATVSAEGREAKSLHPPRDETRRVQSVFREREPRRWNATFLYGATTFYGSDRHQTFGASFRIRLSDRLSVEPEFRYMSLPDESYEWRRGRTEYKHSDIMVAAHIVYDFRDEAGARVVPYVTGGAGWVQTRNETIVTTVPMVSAIPIVPAPSPDAASETTRTASDWLWLGGAFGVRIVVHGGFFISPEVRVGGSNADLSASAVIKAGIGF